jgi:hypothetical protein
LNVEIAVHQLEAAQRLYLQAVGGWRIRA